MRKIVFLSVLFLVVLIAAPVVILVGVSAFFLSRQYTHVLYLCPSLAAAFGSFLTVLKLALM